MNRSELINEIIKQSYKIANCLNKKSQIFMADTIIDSMELSKAISNKDWIIWQKACDAMKTEIIKEVERQWERGAVITRPDLRKILEDVHHPVVPENNDE